MWSIKTGLLAFVLMLAFTLPAAAGSPVNMKVTDGEVREVLTALAAVAGVSIVADDTVSGKITVQLDNIPFDEALDIVTKAKGLDYHWLGSVVIVGSPERMSRSFGEIHLFKLHYAKASEAVDLLGAVVRDHPVVPAGQPGTEKKASQASGKVSRLAVDAATNSLIFSGTSGEAAQIRKVLQEIDIPYQQVLLEAQVLAINHDAAKSLGVEWDWSKGPNYPEYQPPVTDAIDDDDDNGREERITEPEKYIRDKENMVGTIRFGKSPGGYPYELYYQFKINALVTDGKASVLAKPKIMTINGKEAVINIGGEVPVPVTTISDQTTTTSMEYKEAGIILKYTPRINADGYITAAVHTEVSSPVYVPDLKAYKFSKRSADAEVRLKDGETMVIGGLIGKDEVKSMSKIPFLGDLPIVGTLFRSAGNSKSESEVVIFLTAYIVK